MKRSTIIAIALAVAGIAVIAWLATRPRTLADGTSAATGAGEAGAAAGESEATRVTRGIGTIATGIATGVASLAS